MCGAAATPITVRTRAAAPGTMSVYMSTAAFRTVLRKGRAAAARIVVVIMAGRASAMHTAGRLLKKPEALAEAAHALLRPRIAMSGRDADAIDQASNLAIRHQSGKLTHERNRVVRNAGIAPTGCI